MPCQNYINTYLLLNTQTQNPLGPPASVTLVNFSFSEQPLVRVHYKAWFWHLTTLTVLRDLLLYPLTTVSSSILQRDYTLFIFLSTDIYRVSYFLINGPESNILPQSLLVPQFECVGHTLWGGTSKSLKYQYFMLVTHAGKSLPPKVYLRGPFPSYPQ